jgi:PhnB protein
MSMKVEPYLFFEGRCEEAIEYYKRALGAEVGMLMRYKESPEPVPAGMVPPGWDNKVMHANLRIGDSVLMASDGHTEGGPSHRGFALSLSVPDGATAKKYFGALADGGQVVMPLGKTFYSPAFGMVTDRFGVMWMVIQAT